MALRHRHPDWWAFMRPYRDSLPAQGEVLREQSFPDELLALLQDESLVRDPQAFPCGKHAAPDSMAGQRAAQVKSTAAFTHRHCCIAMKMHARTRRQPQQGRSAPLRSACTTAPRRSATSRAAWRRSSQAWTCRWQSTCTGAA